jgi:hypothetical protein
VVSDGAYRGADLRRTVLLADDLLIDRFEVRADSERTMDWFLHVRADEVQGAQWSTRSESMGRDDGYQHLTAVRSLQRPGDAAAPLTLTWKSKEAPHPLATWLLLAPSDGVLLTDSIGYTIDEVVPCVVWRRRQAASVFVAVYDLTGGTVQAVTADEPRRVITVTTPAGARIFTLGENEADVQVR